jgi:hypothetical protein
LQQQQTKNAPQASHGQKQHSRQHNQKPKQNQHNNKGSTQSSEIQQLAKKIIPNLQDTTAIRKTKDEPSPFTSSNTLLFLSTSLYKFDTSNYSMNSMNIDYKLAIPMAKPPLK